MKNEVKLKEQYKKEKKKGFWIGIFFLILSAIFSIIAIATKNYNMFYGVLLQFVAGLMLIFNNIN